MDIQELINSYTQWLNAEIDFEKVGEYYEISTPFLDSQNDYIQFYVRLDGDNIHFTDDGFTLERLLLSGFKFNTNKRKMLNNLLQRYVLNYMIMNSLQLLVLKIFLRKSICIFKLL